MTPLFVLHSTRQKKKPDILSLEQIINLSDFALYKAKENGRNQAVYIELTNPDNNDAENIKEYISNKGSYPCVYRLVARCACCSPCVLAGLMKCGKRICTSLQAIPGFSSYPGCMGEQQSEGLRPAPVAWASSNPKDCDQPRILSKNLASMILSMIMKRIADDWEIRYKYRPVLLETFVEKERFTGSCYRAANWQYIGTTKGRGKKDRHNQAVLPKNLKK